MSLAKLTSKGQLTIPKLIRVYLKLHAGDQVEFVIKKNGEVMVCPKSLNVRDICGMIKPHRKASIEDMNKAIRINIQKRHKDDARD